MVGNNNSYILLGYCACSSLHFEQNKASIRKKANLFSFCIFLSLKLNSNASVFILFFQTGSLLYLQKVFSNEIFWSAFYRWNLVDNLKKTLI